MSSVLCPSRGFMFSPHPVNLCISFLPSQSLPPLTLRKSCHSFSAASGAAIYPAFQSITSATRLSGPSLSNPSWSQTYAGHLYDRYLDIYRSYGLSQTFFELRHITTSRGFASAHAQSGRCLFNSTYLPSHPYMPTSVPTFSRPRHAYLPYPGT